MTARAPATEETQISDALDALLAEFPPESTRARDFLGAQFDAGLAWVHFPVGCGGLGLTPKYQTLVNERLRLAKAPFAHGRNPIGYGMGAPTIVTHGSDEQKHRYLRPLFTGEEVWCQLFSEPGAGSDVAGLSGKAVRDGDEWIVNGQKVWTTLAHISRWGMLIVRTDPDQPKHKGMTYFVVDMQAPGVEVKPLRQITGEAEFNEVFFTDVRIPDSERLSDVGEGWHVAITTLMNERVSIGGAIAPKGSGAIGDLVRIWNEHGDHSDDAARDELMQLWVRAEVLRLVNIRASQNRKLGNPGPEGSVGKSASAELNKDIYNFAMNLMGPYGQLFEDYSMRRPDGVGLIGMSPTHTFLRMRANSIEGGTTEIMKNILGERVLGLPGDIRVDKGKPWSEVPRN